MLSDGVIHRGIGGHSRRYEPLSSRHQGLPRDLTARASAHLKTGSPQKGLGGSNPPSALFLPTGVECGVLDGKAGIGSIRRTLECYAPLG
jgi:hypothetical protein